MAEQLSAVRHRRRCRPAAHRHRVDDPGAGSARRAVPRGGRREGPDHNGGGHDRPLIAPTSRSERGGGRRAASTVLGLGQPHTGRGRHRHTIDAHVRRLADRDCGAREDVRRWVRALAGLDLRVERGEVFAFLGPNGAGKSTTIRLLLELIRPTGGRAWILGDDRRIDPVETRRHVGYVPGDLRLFDRLTGREQLDSLARLRGSIEQARVRL